MILPQERILEDYYQSPGAFWSYKYPIDPSMPHVMLTSGLCSDCYFKSAVTMSTPVNVSALAFQLWARLKEKVREVDWVIGSPYSSIVFSHVLTSTFSGAKHGFTEKNPSPENPKRMIWRRLVIPAGAKVLQCEDVISTMGTVREVRRAVEEGNPEPIQWLPTIATAVYRPKQVELATADITAIITREVRTWPPKKCPLCAAGSPRLDPHSGKNWARLIEVMKQPVAT